jgi:hypothetical protein
MIALEPPFQTPHSTKQPGTFFLKTSSQEFQSLRQRVDVVIVYLFALNMADARGNTGNPFKNQAHRLVVIRCRKVLAISRRCYLSVEEFQCNFINFPVFSCISREFS